MRSLAVAPDPADEPRKGFTRDDVDDLRKAYYDILIAANELKRLGRPKAFRKAMAAARSAQGAWRAVRDRSLAVPRWKACRECGGKPVVQEDPADPDKMCVYCVTCEVTVHQCCLLPVSSDNVLRVAGLDCDCNCHN